MNVVVCVKQVPGHLGREAAQPDDLTLDRASVDAVMNELDEYAVEAGAAASPEAHGGEVTVLTMGPEQAGETIRKALSMGADAGVHVRRRRPARLRRHRHLAGAGQGARARSAGTWSSSGRSPPTRGWPSSPRCSPSASAYRS